MARLPDHWYLCVSLDPCMAHSLFTSGYLMILHLIKHRTNAHSHFWKPIWKPTNKDLVALWRLCGWFTAIKVSNGHNHGVCIYFNCQLLTLLWLARHYKSYNEEKIMCLMDKLISLIHSCFCFLSFLIQIM